MNTTFRAVRGVRCRGQTSSSISSACPPSVVTTYRLSTQHRSFAATRCNLAPILESFWEVMDNIDVTPHGGYSWWEGVHQKSVMHIRRTLHRVDCVIEVRDARAPFSTYNEDLEKLTVGKPRVIVFNKAELADPTANKKLVKFYADLGVPAALCTQGGLRTEEMRKLAEKIAKLNFPTYLREAPINCLVVGMPKVGKSSIANNLRKALADEMTDVTGIRFKDAKRIAKKRKTNGTMPRLTRSIGTVKIRTKNKRDIVLIDAPGFMFPRATDTRQGKKIALLGLTNFQRMQGQNHYRDVGDMVFKTLFMHGMEPAVMSFFRLPLPAPKTLTELQVRAAVTMDTLTSHTRKNMKFMNPDMFVHGLREPGNMEADRVTRQMIDAFRGGKFGRITIDEIPTIDQFNKVTAPPYIRRLYDAECEARAQRAELIRHVRNVQMEEPLKKIDPDAEEEKKEGEEDVLEHEEDDGLMGRRIFAIHAKTVDTEKDKAYSPEKERHTVADIVRQMQNENQPMTRSAQAGGGGGVLASNLEQYDRTTSERRKDLRMARLYEEGQQLTKDFLSQKQYVIIFDKQLVSILKKIGGSCGANKTY